MTQKRAEILSRIKAYEAQVAEAKHDLAHVNATIERFAAPERQRARYMVCHGFFKKGEFAVICVGHPDVDGEMTTRELPEAVMAERDLETSDATLRNSVVFKVVQATLSRLARRYQYSFHDRLTGTVSALPAPFAVLSNQVAFTAHSG